MVKLLSLILLVSNLTFQGISTYAIHSPRFPCHPLLHLIDKSSYPAISILYGTFGHSNKCLRRVLNKVKDKPHLVEIHFSNEAGRRNNRLYEGEFLKNLSVNEYNKKLIHQNPAVIEAVRKRATRIFQRYSALANDNTRLVLSTGLESNFTPSSRAKLTNILRQVWPYEIIQNPINSTNIHSDIEFHGVQLGFTTPCIFNNDGAENAVTTLKAFWEHFSICDKLLWRKNPQGIKNYWIKPRDRHFYFSPKDQSIIKEMLQ